MQRDLYVACGGVIDATAAGYLGATTSGQRAYGYGNIQTEGALATVGGSHGGRGGRFDGSSPSYGNFSTRAASAPAAATPAARGATAAAWCASPPWATS